MLDFAPSPQVGRYAFEPHDKVTISGIAYRSIDVTEAGYIFVRLDGQGVAESFSRAEMSRLVACGQVAHERGALLPEGAKARLEAPSELLSMMSAGQHRRARRKEAAVLAFLEIEEEGRVNRTDNLIKAASDTITGRAAKILKGGTHYSDKENEAGELSAPEFSPRSLRRWVSSYEEFGISGLFDNMGERGNRDRRLCLRSRVILAESVRGYMTCQRKSQGAIYQDVKDAFDKENAIRRAEGRPELVRPSKETVRQAILALDPYQCDVARHGIEAARRKHAPVGVGLRLTRPLERVEMDTWQVDLITLMTDSGLLQFLSKKEKKRLGLDGEKKRWHLTVAMCATTRCILAMRLSRTPNSQATIQTIDMMTRDKGVWADAVDTLTPWPMGGTPPFVYTDCGKEYISYDVRVAAKDLGISLVHAPAGFPEMRGRIERLFRTISIKLMERLTGRTFSNMIERGDHNSKAHAALTVDDLCTVLIRWVVDIYHRLPHDGLDGEMPGACWDRLVEEYGVAPAADVRRRRLALGTRMERSVGKDGITILGVRYQSEVLVRKSLRRRNSVVNIRWYSEDLGAIAVGLDGEWIEVPSVLRRFDGVRARTWIAARRALQHRFKQQALLYESIVSQTLNDIETQKEKAMQRVGLLVEDWSEERLRQEEDRLFAGFGIEPDDGDQEQPYTALDFGDDLETDVTPAVTQPEKREANTLLSISEPDPAVTGTDHHPDEDDPEFEIEEKR
ncbi:Mu transposase C-terminal domain-containing protein [Limimaricola variabilis]